MSWFKSVAGAMVKYGAKALSGVVPFGDVLLDVTKDIWEKYRKLREQGNTAILALDLQAVAAAPAAEVQRAIAQAVDEVAADQPPALKEKLSEYLAQTPYSIRRSLRRPSDPTGTTVPATLALQQARDFLPLLPTALPRFRAGDRPLPGVPLVLEEMLGKGGFGEVWRACHPRDESLKTALKFCLDDRAASSLRHEAKALARVRREGKHPGIVELRQVWDENEPICLEYEYVEGGDLSGLIREMHASGPPSPETVARWMRHLLEPICFVHSLTPPIVHRDLKPGNILGERQKDGSFRLRIADFGISDLAAHVALRDTGGQSLLTMGVGGFTALYASPQQINNETADPRDDIHALGVIWLQMLTGDLNKGRPSGSGWKVPLRARAMPEPMLELLEQCMDDDPGVRPADAKALAERLMKLLESSAVIPPPKKDAPRAEGTAKESKKQELPRELVNSIGMKLMLIPAGTFLMGAQDGEGASHEKPQHEVEITRPFYLGAFQVTQEQYQRVMGKNPSRFNGDKHLEMLIESKQFHDAELLAKLNILADRVLGIDTKRFPVETISWDKAVAFCARLSNLPEEKRAGRTYRLPTEAEWEYACRGGATSHTLYHFGNALSPKQANFKETELSRACPVGSFPANAFGLFDMHGNVWEWCSDWIDPHYYQNSPKKDPQGPEKGTHRALRGGCWMTSGGNCCAASRFGRPPGERDDYIGFRVCFLLDL